MHAKESPNTWTLLVYIDDSLSAMYHAACFNFCHCTNVWWNILLYLIFQFLCNYFNFSNYFTIQWANKQMCSIYLTWEHCYLVNLYCSNEYGSCKFRYIRIILNRKLKCLFTVKVEKLSIFIPLRWNFINYLPTHIIYRWNSHDVQ